MQYTIKRIYLGVVLAAGVCITACNKDFLNTQPRDEAAEDLVFSDPGLTEAFVNDIYNGLSSGGFLETMLASATDETMFTHGYGMKNMVESTISPTDAEYVTSRSTMRWDEMYKRIRACNKLFTKIEDVPFDDFNAKDRLKGETFFLRAYFYHQLVRGYGAVPLINEVYSLGQTDYTVARNTFEECVNFIVNDCDSAAKYLAGKQGITVKGRATEGAALALKSRILLYAASDLHDVPTAKAKSATIAGFAKPELLGYVTGDRRARWQKAKDAARAIIDRNMYAVQSENPASREEAITNIQGMFLKDNTESIFSRYFTNNKDEPGGDFGLYNGANGYHNWAGNTPTQSLVDDYEMSDGTAFDWTNPAHKANPYQNRDPRFYASILYDGANWRKRPADVQAKDPFNQIQTGKYEVSSGSGTVSNPGLDTRSGPIEDWNGSFTGYYIKKFVDTTVDAQFYNQQVPYPFFRYTEILLNCAEACIELGEDAEARGYLNMIRKRAFMPDITESGDALRTRYRKEREIEMVFEEQRFYDVRRWMTAQATIGRPLRGINITGTLKPGSQITVYRYDPVHYNYVYSPITMEAEKRLWLDKMYFMPFQRDEINRNSKLVQNPGY
ncbi:RagB/SusD family nutrient uptake outer membrane protein [Chitinophaga agrisoli]|uniref:RagB/SusD family nutrient uptake outer membrane protein n=1 Tax=Chitinophaga agrisoli TaxID=2607653 RepID=A0A5B2VU18_9BACT|nr:RagB/SusD family nutrient uptake outer membrane protein [Chitinophaga agrisoli]KAA2242535.1 RagB/SusD family nutrient uptake outer membrane protein [Chitinophaga agrisoli]